MNEAQLLAWFDRPRPRTVTAKVVGKSGSTGAAVSVLEESFAEMMGLIEQARLRTYLAVNTGGGSRIEASMNRRRVHQRSAPTSMTS